MKLSGIGIWTAGLLGADPSEVAELAAEVDELGYTSLWMPGFGAASFDRVERLLAATRNLTVGTGILNIWTVTAAETAAAHARIQDAYDDRFLLGLGVSHAELVGQLVENARYEKPLQAMHNFLDGIDAADFPVAQDARVIAALGPKMLGIASARAGGAHPYNVTPEHTAIARGVLGPDRLLIPEQAVALTTDADEARQTAREFLEHYLERPNYANNLRRLGFAEGDFAHGGSDRIVDAMVAWGDVDAIRSRVKEHLDAGADSVCVQVVRPGGMDGMIARPRETWRELAPALTSL